MTWRNCSGVSRVAGTAVPTPALLTRMSTWPSSATAASTSLVASSGLATSVATAIARRPVPSTSFLVSSRRSARRAPSATSAPACASATANATPRPDEAPVTTATLPSRRKASRTGDRVGSDMRSALLIGIDGGDATRSAGGADERRQLQQQLGRVVARAGDRAVDLRGDLRPVDRRAVADQQVLGPEALQAVGRQQAQHGVDPDRPVADRERRV